MNMNGNYVAAWIVSVLSVVLTAWALRSLFRSRRAKGWRGDGTWLMASMVALVGAFAVFMSFAAADIQIRGHDCRERGGEFVRHLGCVDPETNHPK